MRMELLQKLVVHEFVIVVHAGQHMRACQLAGAVRGAQGDGPHAGAACRFNAKGRVLKDDAISRLDAHAPGGLQKDGRLGFAGQAFVAAHHIIRIFVVMVAAAPVYAVIARLGRGQARSPAPRGMPAE
jgi:hypothetical protein